MQPIVINYLITLLENIWEINKINAVLNKLISKVFIILISDELHTIKIDLHKQSVPKICIHKVNIPYYNLYTSFWDILYVKLYC
jgi:hypothetical protein